LRESAWHLQDLRSLLSICETPAVICEHTTRRWPQVTRRFLYAHRLWMYTGSYEFEWDELLNVGFKTLPLIGCSAPHFGWYRLVTNGWYDVSSILICAVGHGMCTHSHPGSSFRCLVAPTSGRILNHKKKCTAVLIDNQSFKLTRDLAKNGFDIFITKESYKFWST